jgi:hypothetical protein
MELNPIKARIFCARGSRREIGDRFENLFIRHRLRSRPKVRGPER